MNVEFIKTIIESITRNYLFEVYDDIKYNLENDLKNSLEDHYNGIKVDTYSDTGVDIHYAFEHNGEMVKLHAVCKDNYIEY